MPNWIFKAAFSLACLCLLFACQSKNPQNFGDTTTLAGLQEMGIKSAKVRHKKRMSKIRETGLRETALSIGAQAGLAARAHQINQALTQQTKRLDQIFDFNALMLPHHVLPPVLLEGRNTLNLANTETIRISDRAYRVAKQAHFVTSAPNWRQYIWMDYQKPEPPNAALLPKTRLERKLWCVYVAKGWNNGVEQANTILEESLARLKEDFNGMILYRKLLAMNMVSPPFVAHTSLGVTGDESEIHIDDRVLRITALPALNVNANEWRAALSKEEDVLNQYRTLGKIAKNTRITISDKAWQPLIPPKHTSERG